MSVAATPDHMPDSMASWFRTGERTEIGHVYSKAIVKRYTSNTVHDTKRKEERILFRIKTLYRGEAPNFVNILHGYNVCIEPHIVMEHCTGGDLVAYRKRILGQSGLSQFPEAKIWDVYSALVSAIKFLKYGNPGWNAPETARWNSIAHRNINPRNVLVRLKGPNSSEEGPTEQYVLADFSSATEFGGPEWDWEPQRQRDRDTVVYMAPEEVQKELAALTKSDKPKTDKNTGENNTDKEVLSLKAAGERADIWSAGAVVHFLALGRPPVAHQMDPAYLYPRPGPFWLTLPRVPTFIDGLSVGTESKAGTNPPRPTYSRQLNCRMLEALAFDPAKRATADSLSRAWSAATKTVRRRRIRWPTARPGFFAPFRVRESDGSMAVLARLPPLKYPGAELLTPFTPLCPAPSVEMDLEGIPYDRGVKAYRKSHPRRHGSFDDGWRPRLFEWENLQDVDEKVKEKQTQMRQLYKHMTAVLQYLINEKQRNVPFWAAGAGPRGIPDPLPYPMAATRSRYHDSREIVRSCRYKAERTGGSGSFHDEIDEYLRTGILPMGMDDDEPTPPPPPGSPSLCTSSGPLLFTSPDDASSTPSLTDDSSDSEPPDDQDGPPTPNGKDSSDASEDSLADEGDPPAEEGNSPAAEGGPTHAAASAVPPREPAQQNLSDSIDDGFWQAISQLGQVGREASGLASTLGAGGSRPPSDSGGGGGDENNNDADDEGDGWETGSGGGDDGSDDDSSDSDSSPSESSEESNSEQSNVLERVSWLMRHWLWMWTERFYDLRDERWLERERQRMVQDQLPTIRERRREEEVGVAVVADAYVELQAGQQRPVAAGGSAAAAATAATNVPLPLPPPADDVPEAAWQVREGDIELQPMPPRGQRAKGKQRARDEGEVVLPTQQPPRPPSSSSSSSSSSGGNRRRQQSAGTGDRPRPRPGGAATPAQPRPQPPPRAQLPPPPPRRVQQPPPPPRRVQLPPPRAEQPPPPAAVAVEPEQRLSRKERRRAKRETKHAQREARREEILRAIAERDREEREELERQQRLQGDPEREPPPPLGWYRRWYRRWPERFFRRLFPLYLFGPELQRGIVYVWVMLALAIIGAVWVALRKLIPGA
ncbi:hypothetical protein DIS24_g11364 [Lasiodiplodia hormozganensis]|uniref:Protein kinase domain-containing protein n=1 Tax=Lasiodiplodia hormozganensis TaxID=869390 RepID=A0AA39WV22_9PEZI|nr:hypothetical protein DIS24_g11364 [Lasiodiplodia hormozganensis]